MWLTFNGRHHRQHKAAQNQKVIHCHNALRTDMKLDPRERGMEGGIQSEVFRRSTHPVPAASSPKTQSYLHKTAAKTVICGGLKDDSAG